MKFIQNVEISKYREFENKHKKSHFLQSYEWGQFCKRAKRQIPRYVGMEDNDGNLVATCLILLKYTPFGFSYGYAPRGFVLDYNNKDVIKEFTNYLKQYMKDNKIIYIKFDPDIKYQDIDDDGNKIDGGENNYELYNYMLSLGYKHTGFYKLYEGNQPRYTFRIDLKKPWEEIEAKFNKSFMKSVKRSYSYNLVVDNDIKIDDFYRLIQSNSSKDDFDPHNLEYYKIFSDEMAKNNNMKYFNISIRPKELLSNISKDIEVLNKELDVNKKKEVDIKNKIARLEKEKEVFSKIDKDEVCVCSLLILKIGHGVCILVVMIWLILLLLLLEVIMKPLKMLIVTVMNFLIYLEHQEILIRNIRIWQNFMILKENLEMNILNLLVNLS